MNVVDMLDAMSKPPLPAPEVVTLDRQVVEKILAELEEASPLRTIVTDLRAALALPKVQLWAMFTPGPNEIYAFASKEDAEQAAADLIAVGQRIRADRIARGESVEFWPEWRAEVIPSPWEPDEHFEEMALEQQQDAKDLRAMAVNSAAEIEALKAEVVQLRQQKTDSTEVPQKPKCDGNHGGPRCADPECWNDDALPDPSTGCPLNGGGAHNEKGVKDASGFLVCACGFNWGLPF